MITRHSANHAFTLMEVLIAVVVFSIVLSAMASVFFGALRLYNRSHSSLAESLPRLQALAFLKRDLGNLVPPDGGLTGPLELSSGRGEASPEFYTTTGALSETTPWPEVQKVSYFLAEPTNQVAGKDLVRSVTRNLLTSTEEDITYRRLLSGVDQLVFQFHDGSQWRDTWDSSTEEVPMPKGIRVQIALTHTNQSTMIPPLELVVPITVQSRTNQVEEAQAR